MMAGDLDLDSSIVLHLTASELNTGSNTSQTIIDGRTAV